jgi:hypothetical protein
MFKLFVVLSIPFSIDMFSCYLALRRNKNKKGASGFPIITMFLYGIFVFSSSYPSNVFFKILLFIFMFLLHAILLFAIPYLHRQICRLG